MTDRKLMSIMELANDILTKNNKAMTFADIFDAICEIKGINDEDKAKMISQVYADFISSARFMYVGDDEWDVKGRQSIELWDKDGAYYDEYPDFEEELSQFEDIDEDYVLDEDEEDEEESTYEQDFEIDDEDEEELEDEIEEDIDEELLEEFKEEFSDEDNMYDDFEDEEEDYIEDEEDLVFEEEENAEDFDDEEYNEYMDDYEKMYDD